MDKPPQPRRYCDRECSDCDTGRLVYVETRQAGIGPERRYTCASCGISLDLPPEGFVGTCILVWALVSYGLIWLFVDPYAGVLTYLLVGGGIVIGAFAALIGLIKHVMHPMSKPDTDLDDLTSESLSRVKIVTWFWDLGFFKTPLIAILLAVFALFLAMLFGLAMDRFFT